MDMTEAFRYFGALALVLALVGVAGLGVKRVRDSGDRGIGEADVDRGFADAVAQPPHLHRALRWRGACHRHRTAGCDAHLERTRETVARSTVMRFVRDIPLFLVLMLAAIP